MSEFFDLPSLRVAGDARSMGLAQGEHWRELIHAFVDARWRALRANLWAAGTRDLDGFAALAQRCMLVFADWDPEGHTEHQAVAEAADIDALRLFAAYNLTDLRDIALFGAEGLLAGGPTADSEGCTAIAIPGERCTNGQQVVGQTWDLNPPDIAFVVANHRLPIDGPETWSVTLAGAPCLVGMNEHGLYFGTTNIKTTDATIGIGYMNLLHRIARCPDRRQAIQVVGNAPRAGAHTFWMADETGATELECSATIQHRRDCQHEALVQTNHCLADDIAALAAEPTASQSSSCRLDRARGVLAAGTWDVDAVRGLFADRSDGVDSINRLHDDGLETATNACAIAVPQRREFHACRGPADHGVWQQLHFERG